MATRIRIAVAGASFALATAVAAYIGYLQMFTGFLSTDDEGAMLIMLRAFVSGQALYKQIVIQYGPFYFQFFSPLGALGVPFDHDSGRFVTLALWLALALVAGLSVFAFTRNLALGLSTHLIVFATATLTSEPMHPAGLLNLLIIGIVAVALISAGRKASPRPFFVIGALAAAAILVKINVGGFAAISIAFACVLTIPALARLWPLRLVAIAVVVAIPFLLVKSDLDQAWAQRFAFHIALSVLALVVATTASRLDPDRRLAALGWLFSGGAVLAVVILVVASLKGSSPNDLLHGIILNPLDQRLVYAAPLTFPSSLTWGVVGLVGALLWTLYRMFARRPEIVVEGGIRVVTGLVIWVMVLGSLHIPGVFQLSSLNNPLVLPVALAWVVAAPRGTQNGSQTGSNDGFEKLDFARTLVAALAILQTLQAFPVPGSQVKWAALTLVPLGAICIADGLSQLGLSRARLQLATSLVFLTLTVSWLPSAWRQSRYDYASGVSLGLAGASLVHVPPEQAALLRQVTQAIRDNCDTFISIPGLDSFYLLAQVGPPTPLPTRWMWLAGDIEHQQALVEASKRIDRLCVLENDYLITAWTHGHETNGPLVSYIQSEFVTAYSFEHYSILKRRT